MDTDLLTLQDLEGFPGAPFSDAVVDAAVTALRNSLGWHVAPVRSETITVDSRGGRYLFVPTLQMGAISSVQDLTGSTPVAITDYFVGGQGTLVREAGWPCREQAVSVTLSHGYAACPADLFQVVAEMCQMASRGRGVQSVRVDDFSETYVAAAQAQLVDQHPMAAAYRVPRRTR